MFKCKVLTSYRNINIYLHKWLRQPTRYFHHYISLKPRAVNILKSSMYGALIQFRTVPLQRVEQKGAPSKGSCLNSEPLCHECHWQPDFWLKEWVPWRKKNSMEHSENISEMILVDIYKSFDYWVSSYTKRKFGFYMSRMTG